MENLGDEDDYPRILVHHDEVNIIQQRVKSLYEAGQSVRIYHGSTNSTRPSASKSTNVVDTSTLDKVIEIDAEQMTAIVQANVPMDALLVETLKHNLMPLVITEFPGITVGGAFSGTAGESSSFKHGFFDETVTKAEIILANGELYPCANDTRADLFKGLPGSLGTLGVVTLLHIKLKRAYKYVEVAYYPFTDIRTAIEKFQECSTTTGSNGIDFLDGIAYADAKGKGQEWCIITGRMADINPHNLPVQRIVRPTDPYYFMHVQETSKSGRMRVMIPLLDYIFRYNRGIFWLGK